MYKAIRQLVKEKYIMPLPRGKYLNQEVLTLTELGFEVVLMDRDDILNLFVVTNLPLPAEARPQTWPAEDDLPF